MKALLLVGLWLLAGAVLAFRRPRPVLERALVIPFWPFFLGGVPPAGPGTPPQRLARAVEGDPEATALARTLEQERERLLGQLGRLEAALTEAGQTGARSRAVLSEALDRVRRQLRELDELADEAAVRFLVARETAGAGTESVLQDLRQRLAALQEVEEGSPRPAG